MKVSLNTLLQTGRLGDLRHGMSQEEVRALLGEPDAAGGTSRKHPRPSIFLYGTVELNFRQEAPRHLTSIWWEAGEKGIFRLTSTCEIIDWAFTPAWTLEQVEDYLREQNLPFKHHNPLPSSKEPTLTLTSGVELSFENGCLYGVFGTCGSASS